MESDAKLWKYIYYDQKSAKESNSGKYLETSTIGDDCRVDQLCDQLLNDQLLMHSNETRTKTRNLYSNHHNKSQNHPNYSKLQLTFADSNHRNKTTFKRLIKRIIFYKHFYRFNYLTLLLIASLIVFICILKATSHFHSSASLQFASFSAAAFRTNYTYFDQLSTSEQLANERLNSFDRVLTIETECASYVGTVEESGFEFLGIQYATPPLKSLRFKPTVPIWNDSNLCKPKRIKKAKKFSSECFQINPFNKKFHGSEDCLYLNIWTPRIDNSASLNVMIYFHPGFLQFGSGHLASGSTFLSPSASLAKKLNIVFVSFNYRLDALGFFPAGQFVNSTTNGHTFNTTNRETRSFESAGNYALYDQMTAVEWVKRNIRQFGGDPKRLTVFGSDGGGASILALLSNRKFRETINKVWLSGPAVYLDKQFSLNKFLSKNSRVDQRIRSSKFDACRTVECFQNLSAKEIIIGFLDGDEAEFKINDQNDLPINGIYPNQWIQVDNNLVNDAYPFDRTLDYDKLQLLIGTSTNSIEFWPGPNDLRKWSWLQYAKYVSTSLDSFNSTISQLALQQYPPDLKNFKLNHNLIDRKSKSSVDLNESTHTKSIEQASQQYRRNEINQLHNENLNAKRSKLNPESLYTRMVSDIKQTCPINIVSENLVKFHNSIVFRYIATSRPSYPIKLFGHNNRFNFHLFDLIAFFNQIHLFIDHPTRNDLLFVRQMQNLVMNFIEKDEQSTGIQDVMEIQNLVDFKRNNLIKEMNTYALNRTNERWPAYPKSIALVDEGIKFVKEYSSEQCKFWQSIGLDRYAWVC